LTALARWLFLNKKRRKIGLVEILGDSSFILEQIKVSWFGHIECKDNATVKI